MPLTIVDQPHVLLSHPVDETITGSGVDNNVPLEFTDITTNVGGCTVNGAKSRITVPASVTYLCCSVLSGTVQTAASGDGIIMKYLVNGSNAMSMDGAAFPIDTFGSNNNDEYAFHLILPLVLTASDYVEVALDNVGGDVSATVSKGYFSVVKLH